MSFSMQAFLNARALLHEQPPHTVPAEVLAALEASELPRFVSASRRPLERQPAYGEVFELELEGPQRATLHILGPELNDAPIFRPDSFVSVASLRAALALAAGAGVAGTPKILLHGTVVKRGKLRRLEWCVVDSPGPSGTSLAEAQRVLRDSPVAEPDAGALPRHDSVPLLLGLLRAMASATGAGELDEPLARLEAEAAGGACKAEPLPPSLVIGQGACAADAAAPGSLHDLGAWATAAVCDARLSSDEAAPWAEIRHFSAVVKARWLVDLLRRNPASAPRCDLSRVLLAHDAAQARLVDGGWLPPALIAPGSSSAKLAKTFPEEICASY